MEFTNFNVSDLEEINRRTIERLRLQKQADVANMIQASAHAGSRSSMTAAGSVTRTGQTGKNLFGNSPSAKFSRSDIRNAFIAAKKKLGERA